MTTFTPHTFYIAFQKSKKLKEMHTCQFQQNMLINNIQLMDKFFNLLLNFFLVS